MRRIKFRKRLQIENKRILLLILILICINTAFFVNFFINKLNKTFVETARRELKEVTFNIVTKNLTKDILKEVTTDDLIVINKNRHDEITNVDFKLEKAYEVQIGRASCRERV